MRLNSLEKLIVRCGLRDRAAFDKLYDKSAPRLFGICLHITKKQHVAESALQDAYMRIWLHSRHYVSGNHNPTTWLATLARNASIERLRQEKGRLADLETLQDHGVGMVMTPEQLSAVTIEAKRVKRGLTSLGSDQQQAIRDAYLNGASYADLALRSDVPLNEMRAWLCRALINLRENIQK